VILQGLRIGLRGRKIRNDDLEDFTQEAIIRIVENLDGFRGDSHFTTWAHKIALRVAFSELRRKRWKEVSLDSLLEESETIASITPMATTPSPPPDEVAGREMVMQLVMTLMEEELTEKQRDALMAVMVHGMPMEVVAEKMGTNRNALYKLLHDARMSLRKALIARDLTLEDLLSGL
jgi:RNA polymerase sigma-70 factor (ECF subfamily)